MGSNAEVGRSGCPISFALEIFGDRWTLLVLRDLILKGRRRYRELLAAEEGIATNILTDRLRRLEAKGLIERRGDDNDRRQFLYSPTERAIDVVPLLVEMAAWGARNDPDTAADAEFIQRFDSDREGLIASVIADVRASLG